MSPPINWTKALTCAVLLSVTLGIGVPKNAPPAFFLQDPNDGLCLAGADFKRCAIDTLWFVTGRPGSYQLHHRKVEDDGDELCLDKVNCSLLASSTRLGSCKHCGAKKFNILGDQESGYVLSEDGGKFCLSRNKTNVMLLECEKGATSMQLQFASREDILTMQGAGSKLVNYAGSGDHGKVIELLEEGVDVNSRDWDNLTAVIAASAKGNVDLVKLLVGKGAQLGNKDKDSITALMEASIMGHRDVAVVLIDSGADVDAAAASGVSAIWLAAGEGRAEIVELLASKGADVNNRRMDGITALMAACVGGHLEAAKTLVNHGAQVGAVDQDGLSAVINAAENGSVPLVSFLLDHGASANNMSSSGFNPLIVAAAGGHAATIAFLASKGANVEAMHTEGVNALMYAAAGGHEAAVKLLLELGADVHALHANGGSALMEAATNGNVSVVRMLLDAGSDAHLRDNDNVTALMSSAAQGHVEVTQILLDLNVPVNGVAASGGTALMFAAGSGHVNVTELLLKNGADVNARVVAAESYIEQLAEAIASGKEDVEAHKDGVTALHVASLGGHLGVVKALLDAGANPRAKDDSDASPLLNAVSANFGDVAYLLVDYGADPNEVYIDEEKRAHNLLWDSIVVGNTKFASLLVSKGANLSHKLDHHATVLIQAARKGQSDVVEAIIERQSDIDVDAADDDGVTALIAAASEGHTFIVSALVTKTLANVNAQDKDGTNALMASAVRGHKEVVEILLGNGVDINAQNVDGHTALMFAYNGKHQVASLHDKFSEYMTPENAVDDDSTTIIQKALETHTTIVNLLVEKGADVDLKDLKGNAAVDFDYQGQRQDQGRGRPKEKGNGKK